MILRISIWSNKNAAYSYLNNILLFTAYSIDGKKLRHSYIKYLKSTHEK